nr:uncharacterized protein LOC129381839 [Dermacentor andersoni]
MVKDVPLDYMHLVCLGVMQKLLVLWVRGPKEVRLGSKVRSEISERNIKLAKFIPSDFNRKPRSLVELDRWKATELRFFLLYGGPLVLSSTIPSHMYENFLTLHVAITILASPNSTASEVSYAGDLLNIFLRNFINIYGQEQVSHNVHGLSHIASDVLHLGSLDAWSGLYIVVKFPEEDDAVAIIHKNWIDGNGCMWPPQTKYIKSLLKAGAMPGNDWRSLPCEVVEAFANYDDAVRGLRKAEDNSDIASASERGRGKRKKKRRLYSDEDEMPLPQPPQSMQKRATHGIAERSARIEPSSISTVSQHSAYNERMHGTAKRSGKESLHSWNVPQCSAYNGFS